MSYFFHYVRFAKEDGQERRGGHLNLWFQPQKWGNCRKRRPCTSHKGAEAAPASLRVPHLTLLASLFRSVSKLLGDLWRQVQKISLSNLFLQIYPLSPITSNFILIHSQEAIPFFFLPTPGHNTENLCRAVSLTGDGSGFNLLTDDLSYFYNFFSAVLLETS